jgi:hypothetical protein
MRLSEIDTTNEARIPTGMSELDTFSAAAPFPDLWCS